MIFTSVPQTAYSVMSNAVLATACKMMVIQSGTLSAFFDFPIMARRYKATDSRPDRGPTNRKSCAR